MANLRRQFYNTVRRPDDPPPPPPPPSSSFAGDPGEGNVLLGHSATGSRNAEFDRMDAILGAPYGIARLFDGGSGTIDWSKNDYHRSRGRVTAWSVKNNGAGVSNQDLADMNATARTWLDGLSSGIDARSAQPIGFVIHHEPDNDITTLAAAEVFREAKRQAYHRLKVTNGLGNLTWMDATWMGGASFGNTTRDWRWWSIDWKGTTTGGSSAANPNPADFYTGPYVSTTSGSATDIVAIDAYVFWGVEGHPTANWVSWRTDKWLPFYNTVSEVFAGKAYAVLEYACAAYCGDPTHTNEVWSAANRTQTERWMDDAYATFLEYNIRWASWFTSFDTATHLDNFDPNRWRYAKLAAQMRLPTSVRVPVT